MSHQDENQLIIPGFMDPAIGKINPTNRWIVLANQIPWSSICEIYNSKMNQKMGAPSKKARLVIGALILKHKLKLSDEETVDQISENPYFQYFCGLPKYTTDKPFDASLFVYIRKRFTIEDFNSMSHCLQQFEIEISEIPEEASSSQTEEILPNIIVADATAIPQEIPYPTDLELVAKARIFSEKAIDILWSSFKSILPGNKPRTYRKKAQKEYLLASKRRKQSQENWLKATDVQLRYLERNIKFIHTILNTVDDHKKHIDNDLTLIPFKPRDLKLFYVMQEVASQQRFHQDYPQERIPHRIVNFFQPHIRPIVRGKKNAPTEFGAKIALSMDDGYSYIDHASWENFYEGEEQFVQKHVDEFKKRNPDKILNGFSGDQLYGNKKAREYLKNEEIEFLGKSLGRPPKNTEKATKNKEKEKIHNQLRNEVEGKFGQLKRGYNLDQIKSKGSDTSFAWIGCALFITNLVRFQKGIFFDSIFEWIITVV